MLEIKFLPSEVFMLTEDVEFVDVSVLPWFFVLKADIRQGQWQISFLCCKSIYLQN